MSVDVRTIEGDVTGTVELDAAMFGIVPNGHVLHQVVTAQLAAARRGTHSTKTRAEVAGGGKKPFKQKGTGRARAGSTRAPNWSGGGVALGPKPRSYRQKTPRKMIQLALRSALSDRAAEARVAVVEEWPWTTAKTKDAKAALAALGLEGKVLVVLDREEDEAAYLAFRNLGDVQLILTGELNAYDVLCNDWIVFTLRTLPGATSNLDQAARDDHAPEADEVPDEPAQADATEAVAGSEDAGAGEAMTDEAPGDSEPDGTEPEETP